MKTLKRILLIFSMMGLCNLSYSQSLTNAFNAIAKLPDFAIQETSAKDRGYPVVMGMMKPVGCPNSDPRDKVLDILKNIPNDLLKINQITEREKIFSVYTEKINNDKGLFMQFFIGKGTNDLTAILFEGASFEEYNNVVNIIKKENE